MQIVDDFDYPNPVVSARVTSFDTSVAILSHSMNHQYVPNNLNEYDWLDDDQVIVFSESDSGHTTHWQIL